MPVDLTSIILGAIAAGGLVGAAAAPSMVQARRWRTDDKNRDAQNAVKKEVADADAAKALVQAAGVLVTNALSAQVQGEKDRSDLRQQLNALEKAQSEQRAASERIVEGLRQDHQAALRRIKSDYESEFEALHRQIEGLVLRNAKLESDLLTERDRSRQVQTLSDQQQLQLVSQQAQIANQQSQINGLEKKLREIQAHKE